MIDSYLDKMRSESENRLEELRAALQSTDAWIADRACVYATGSFGRLEAGPLSDLDLFIVVGTQGPDGNSDRLMDGIDEIKLKFKLIEAVENAGIAKFDGGGRFLQSHKFGDFVRALGSQADDYHNTFTGRLLLMLESRPLLGRSVYDRLLEDVMNAYFRDYPGNEESFIPSFLINDILRLWRTFCVNYEFSRKKGSDDIKIKNLKLKFSRMMTCYSAIMYLLSTHARAGTVSPQDVKVLVSMTPVERISCMKIENCLGDLSARERFADLIERLLDEYSRFLELMHRPKPEILSEYGQSAGEWKKSSYVFGQNFAEAISMLGMSKGVVEGLYRMVLI